MPRWILDYVVKLGVAACGTAGHGSSSGPRGVFDTEDNTKNPKARQKAFFDVTDFLDTDSERQFGALRLGNLCIHISAPSRMYLEDFAAIYAAALHDLDKVPPAELYLDILENPGKPDVEIPEDGLVIVPPGELYTEAMFTRTTFGNGAPRVRLTVMDTSLRMDRRHMYLVVLLNKILFQMGYIRLHSSAVSLDGKANAFIGDRGAGKSTTCAYLAKRGGLILADDDVMMRFDSKSVLVSGCDERMRIMPDTEAHLFGKLDVRPQEFGGFLKKEIRTATQFSTDPYVDHGLHRIFFPNVGENFLIKRLPPSQLVMRLMSILVPANRFAGHSDHSKTLQMLTDIADRVSVFELTLSRDFKGLDNLFEFLKSDA